MHTQTRHVRDSDHLPSMAGVHRSLNATLQARERACGPGGNGCNPELGHCAINGSASTMANVVQAAAQFTQHACVPRTSARRDRLAWQQGSVCDDPFAAEHPQLKYTATHGKLSDNYHNDNSYVMHGGAVHHVPCAPRKRAPAQAPSITQMKGLGSKLVFQPSGDTAYTVSALDVDRDGTHTYNTKKNNYIVHA